MKSITAEDYKTVLSNIASLFLQMQLPQLTHTFIFENKFYVVKFISEEADPPFSISPDFPPEKYFQFLAEFGFFALKEVLNIFMADNLSINTSQALYIVTVVNKDKLGISKQKAKRSR